MLGRHRPGVRNARWFHMENDQVISMPDKWEYPWYAAWDLAFHTVALEQVDHEFAQSQLSLMLDESYLHPSGQIPAYYRYYGDSFRIECPTGSGKLMNLYEVAQELSRRLLSTFLRGPDGKRPVYGDTKTFQEDPHWRDLLLFYEYFHGDTGVGLGASHQTGWTGIVIRFLGLLHLDPKVALEQGVHGRKAPVTPLEELDAEKT